MTMLRNFQSSSCIVISNTVEGIFIKSFTKYFDTRNIQFQGMVVPYLIQDLSSGWMAIEHRWIGLSLHESSSNLLLVFYVNVTLDFSVSHIMRIFVHIWLQHFVTWNWTVVNLHIHLEGFVKIHLSWQCDKQ